MKKDTSLTKDPVCGMTNIRSSRAAWAFALTICSSIRALHAQPAQGHRMRDMDGGWMGGWFGGGMGGGMWLWTVIGVLVVVFLAVAIIKLSKK